VSDVFRMCWEKTTHLSKGLCGSEPYIAPEQFEHVPLAVEQQVLGLDVAVRDSHRVQVRDAGNDLLEATTSSRRSTSSKTSSSTGAK
jgi:hypothetical protein